MRPWVDQVGSRCVAGLHQSEPDGHFATAVGTEVGSGDGLVGGSASGQSWENHGDEILWITRCDPQGL